MTAYRADMLPGMSEYNLSESMEPMNMDGKISFNNYRAPHGRNHSHARCVLLAAGLPPELADRAKAAGGRAFPRFLRNSPDAMYGTDGEEDRRVTVHQLRHAGLGAGRPEPRATASRWRWRSRWWVRRPVETRSSLYGDPRGSRRCVRRACRNSTPCSTSALKVLHGSILSTDNAYI